MAKGTGELDLRGRWGDASDLLRLIHRRGGLSRIEAARELGLSASAMTPLVRALIGHGLLRETGAKASGGGRPRVMLDLDPGYGTLLGLHLGPDSAQLVIADLAGAPQQRPIPLPAPANDDPSPLVDALERLRRKGGPGWDALAAGGVVLGEVGPRRAEVIGAGQRLTAALQDAFGIGVAAETPSNAIVVAERMLGLARAYENYAVVSLQNEIGSGISINGDVYRGKGQAGEIGHLSLAPYSGAACRCGKCGCLASLASLSAISRQALKRGLSDDIAVLAHIASQGDPEAIEIFDCAGRWIGQALAQVANLFDLEAIVFRAPQPALNIYLLKALNESFRAHGYNFDECRTGIVISPDEGDGYLRGAVGLALDLLLRQGGMRRPP
ncbi:ROK family transcriptional regulator [Inquilinus sp.]|uniref:ROK family transcriptional regulator n=1 Tax=Inquilinus sp. TaxID=1932117 RepID=UPI0031D83D50